MTALEITTPRTVLRPFTANDAAEVLACITPRITRYMAWDPPSSAEAFEETWRDWIADFAAETGLHLVARARDDACFTGLVGVHALAGDTPELGIWLREEAHGRGFGTELIGAAIRWASATRPVRSFEYPVAEANIASRRIAEAHGGQVYERRRQRKFDEVVYRIPPLLRP